MNPRVREIDVLLAAADALPRKAGCVVAVSGGRDSMLLLEILAALRARHRWRLVAAHFHHGLRGAEADADAGFVADAAKRLGLRLVPGNADVRRRRRSGESIEAAARRLRHAFLAGVARREHCDWIATGHHADDQVELFLMRLLRGAGGQGLRGMRIVDPSPADPALRIVRPLLPFDGAWLDAAAHELGVVSREDSSNRDGTFLRNRVRHQLIPLLRESFQPALARVLLREQAVLGDQAEFVAQAAESWLPSGHDPGLGDFDRCHVALQREVIRVQLERSGIGTAFELIEDLRATAGKAVQLDPRRAVVRDANGRLRVVAVSKVVAPFRCEERTIDLDAARGRVRLGKVVINWKIVPAAGAFPNAAKSGRAKAVSSSRETFDADRVGVALCLRHWRAGDRFQPIGLAGTAKLQDLFVNAKVPVAERRDRVLAEAASGTIFWVEGLRIGEAARVTSSTQRVLVWSWRRTQQHPS